ncbi:MAG: restriction endonuclease subunit S [Nitrospiraceae bacterium]|nr:restriction endonuclease subunit S [Nitrospiraceae bacterium]
MGEWKEYKIKNLGLVVTGKTPSSKFPEEFGFDMPFITPSDYKYYGKWAEYSDRGLSKNGVKKLQNKILPIGSVLVTCIGSDMGKVVLNKVPVITNQQINSIIPNQNLVTTDFLYYKIIDCYETLRMYGQAGSAVPIVNKGDFEEIILEVPEDIEEQKSIASILSSLDDKIDLLHRRNKTLEALAETLFRQWFVEEVEEGWEMKALENLIIFDPREKVSSNIEYTFFDMKCLSDSSMTISEGIKRTVNSGSAFRNGDTLLAKITPCLENGKTGYVMNLKDDELARGSTEFIVMRAKEGVSPYFVYCLSRYSDFRNTAIMSMTGTSGRQRVQTAMLKDYEIKYSKAIMDRFHSACYLHFEKIKQNQIQIRTLTRLRDTLLPKLMSGEVRIQLPLPPSLTKEGEIRLKEK